MLLAVKNLHKSFKGKAGKVQALSDVSFELDRGQALGLVGESGSGKSTLARIVMHLLEPDAGQVFFEDKKVAGFWHSHLKDFRRKVQIVFQNPFSSLDPRMSVGASLAEAFHIDGMRSAKKVRAAVHELLSVVNLPVELERRLPHELSGGECQRIAIARALSRKPELLICDEPVSSLDLLAQARILNLFLKLQKERSISLLFISHDLRVVRHLCDKLLVLKEGAVCEQGELSQVFEKPQHPYTRELISSSGIGYNERFS
jgi:ABC-type glutathione transport system ATPase component